jgi:putative protease
MTSRQCFFQQTMGCEKTVIDERCIQECSKSTSIINLKGDSFLINKQKGGYPCIYSDKPFLNTDIIDELAGFFDGFFIDLSLDPSDNIGEDKTRVIGLFENLLNGKEDAKRQIKEVIKVSTDSQYKKGL